MKEGGNVRKVWINKSFIAKKAIQYTTYVFSE